MQLYAGNENKLKSLLIDGVSLNATDQNGNSALLLAAQKGKYNNFD